MSNDARLKYTRPELRHYGALTALVQGNSGSLADGGGSSMQMMMGK